MGGLIPEDGMRTQVDQLLLAQTIEGCVQGRLYLCVERLGHRSWSHGT